MVERFEDLIALQKARRLAALIYAFTRRRGIARDFGLSGQMQRSATSIACNIAEGFERGKRAEFAQFLSIAKSSCAELRTQLYIAFDAGYLEEGELNQFLSNAEEVANIIGGLRMSVARQRDAQKKTRSRTQSSVLSPQSSS